MIFATIEGVNDETCISLGSHVGVPAVTCYVQGTERSVLRLDEESVRQLNAALAQWLAERPKPCSDMHKLGARCQAGNEGHDGEHWFEVTW